MKLKVKLILVLSVTPLLLTNAQQYVLPIAKTVSVKEFKKLLEDNNGILIDVRSSEEFAEERIEGAANIDVQCDDFRERLHNLSRNIPYFVYCNSGKRSLEAMKIMNSEGFIKVYNLKGGILVWKKAHLPTVK